MTEEVVVTGENVAQLDTQSSEIGGTVTGKQINKLVLNGRNFTQLVKLTVPGVVDQTGSREGPVGIAGNVAYSINGGRTEYNNWELDGGDNMDNGSNATLNVYPNLEAIAEFKVLTSNYGAQYGTRVRERSRSKRSPEPRISMAALFTTAETISLTPTLGRIMGKTSHARLIKNMTGVILSEARSTSPRTLS